MSDHHKDATGLDTPMASVHLSERREARYAISFEIEVSGLTSDGLPFHERTTTINVSKWGCGFFSSVALSTDDIVSVRRVCKPDEPPVPEQPPAFFQVMRVERKGQGWLIGAWKMGGEEVWGADLEKLAKPAESRLESRKQRGAAQRSVLREKKDT